MVKKANVRYNKESKMLFPKDGGSGTGGTGNANGSAANGGIANADVNATNGASSGRNGINSGRG